MTILSQRQGAIAYRRSSSSAAGVKFAVNAHYYGNATQTDRNAISTKFQSANCYSMRIDLGWNNAQPSSSTFNSGWLTDVDAIVNTNFSRGIRSLLIMYLTPGWANSGQSANTCPQNASDYANYCGAVAARYVGKNVDYAMWNEPNYPVQSFFVANPNVSGTVAQQYVGLVVAAYPAIKAADPAARVVAGCCSGTDIPWLTSCFSAGMGGYFDVLSVHPYQSPSDVVPETTPLSGGNGVTYNLTGTASARTLLNNQGLSSTPIWLTEFGYSTFTNTGGEQPWARGVSYAQQADYVTRAAAVLNANPAWGVDALFWYVARDEPTFSGTMEQNYGILYHDVTEKPSFASFQSYQLLH